MPMIYRRSWEKQIFGSAGAISSPLPFRTGTDGAFGGSPTWSAPVQSFTSATAAFVAGDVGRLIRLTGTPANRYDGYYIIDAINSGTSVNLRKNHNISGHPGSPAVFGQSGSSITWRISESCTFTSDTNVPFNQSTHPGAYVSISGATNAGNNNGLWRISHFVSANVVVLCKSFTWYIGDIRSGAVAFTSDDGMSFAAESNLYWNVTDREPFNGMDAFEVMVQAAIDAGWCLWQQRGPCTGNGGTADFLADVILRSVGEADVNLPEGKVMFLRLTANGNGRTAVGIYPQGLKICWGLGLGYDRTTSPGTSPGSGIGFLRGKNASAPIQNTFNMTTASAPSAGDASWDDETGTGGADLLTPGRGGQAIRYHRYDMAAWGNADEFSFMRSPNGGVTTSANSLNVITWGSVKPVGQNPVTCAIAAATTGGGTATLTVNTGSHDLSTLGYQVGDRIFVRGNDNTSYVEGGTIASFTNTGGVAPFGVTITALAATWRAGAYGSALVTGETYRGFIGADPFPAAFNFYSGGQYVTRLHNVPNLQDATGKDYDNTNLGVVGANDVTINSWAYLAPNYRTGNPGVAFLQIRYDTGNEFRGKLRNVEMIRGDILPYGKKLFDPVSGLYWSYVGWSIGQGSLNLQATSIIAGPFTKAMAGVR